MNPNYSVFERFPNREAAAVLTDLFESKDIDYKLVDNSADMDITFAHNMQSELQLLVAESDFEKATDLLEKSAERLIKDVDKDHYLFDFSNEELYEILLKQDEWSPFDRKLAQKILKERGQEVDDDLMKSLLKQRINELEKPQEGNKGYIVAGYIMAIIGGFSGLLLVAISVMIGLYLWRFKRTLPDGRKVYLHDKKARTNGMYILILSLATFTFTVLMMAYHGNIWFFY